MTGSFDGSVGLAIVPTLKRILQVLGQTPDQVLGQAPDQVLAQTPAQNLGLDSNPYSSVALA